jgi:hypothetical protein
MSSRRGAAPDGGADGGRSERFHAPVRRLRWALYAYPRKVRDAEGDLLASLACDLLDAGRSSIGREALGLVRGGLAMRLGLAAHAPWEAALRRAAVAIAGVVLAIACGSAAATWGESAYPAEAWMAVLAAPALVIAGQLAGRRVPVAAGAVLLLFLGVAAGNGHAVPLAGTIEWDLKGAGWRSAARGADLPLLSSALPGSVVLLASAAHRRRRVSRSSALTTSALIIAAAVGVYLTLENTAALNPLGTVRLGDVRFNGLGLCLVVASCAALVASAVQIVRRRRDPTGMLAAALVLAAVVPVASLHVAFALPLGGPHTLLIVAASATLVLLGVTRLARVSAAIASEPTP